MNKNRRGEYSRTRAGFKKWTAFYKSNPHMFAEDYLGIKLYLFQKFLLWAMNKYDFFMYLASRGQGKSWIIAVYCIIRCILYPNTNIVIASGTKGQARLIITEKILSLKNNSSNLSREIKEYKTSANDCYVLFWNNSKIQACTSNDNARGLRANILIVDEFRLITKSTLDKVLQPFLNVNRIPPYLSNPKYSHLTEENKEIYISSCWYKSHWIWDSFNSYLKNMLNGENYFVCALPWKLSTYHNLLSKNRVRLLRKADDFDQVSWDMEYEALFVGENERAYFKLDDIQSCRTIPKAYSPPTTLEYLEYRDKRKKHTNIPRQAGEVRIVGMDIAMMASTKKTTNDTTIFSLVRLLPDGREFIRHLVYMEKMEGQHSETQSIRLKQLYYDFEADYVAMDCMGVGLAVYDNCTKILYDEERDVEYPAWTVINNEAMDDRKLDKNAIPCIYSIKATAEINHKVATGLRSDIEKKKLKLLISDIEAKDNLIEKNGYLKKTTEEQVRMLRPYIQTTAFQNELVNLVYRVQSGFIKIEEQGTTTKDRYSSVGYANFLATVLGHEMLCGSDDDNVLDYCLW